MSLGNIRWAAAALVVVLASGPDVRAAEADKDIVETAKAAGSFNTLLTAATEAGLVDTLKGDGPFTMFAPTDEAFAKVPEEMLNALLRDKAKLKEVLLYHVVQGKVMAADAVKLDSAKTVQGQPIMIKAQGGKVMINNAQVTSADIKASNGVIHVINSVLLPPAGEVSDGAGKKRHGAGGRPSTPFSTSDEFRYQKGMTA
ncbi:MAG TPA: fasciclin domain-containing protein [Isosphaeraceae bacterium]|nr:fasciclin domain-containing protein [Isosphaeraceae bacterium]